MSNQQILEKAISKASNSGWDEQKWQGGLYEKEPDVYLPIYGIIFSHDFCRALWGEGCYQCVNSINEDDHFQTPAWEHHIQEMAIADDPIKYLGEHLDA